MRNGSTGSLLQDERIGTSEMNAASMPQRKPTPLMIAILTSHRLDFPAKTTTHHVRQGTILPSANVPSNLRGV